MKCMLRRLKTFNLPEIEEKVLRFWKDNAVFEKSLKNREGKKYFRFFEGPPTANGKPHIGHAETRVFKDIILRYKTMRGYFTPRRAGWDTHGLPVEIEVEKELGLKNKQEIERFGIAEFNARAKMSVWKYKSEWERFTERIGFWIDLNNPYVTYTNDYIETLWWVLAQVAKKKLLKKLYKVVPWCPRCQTPLSSHELAQPGVYKKTKDPSLYVKFAVRPASPKRKRGELAEFLLVWTTTPWTLPANVAIAVNPGLIYTKYKVGNEYFWSYNLPPEIGGSEIEVVEKMSGIKLIGLSYEPLYKTGEKGATSILYKVIGADFVSTEEGTGLVHIAPAFGEDDLNVFKKEINSGNEEAEIPLTIDDRGFMNKGLPGAGKFIKDADQDIIADLEKRGFVYKSGTIEHDYPFCWRCSRPLIYFSRYSWFIEMSKLSNQLLAVNQKINWIPAHLKEGRFGEWLKDVKDWAISRERYWGTPLPIWEHIQDGQCKEVLVVGGIEDLNKFRFSQNRFFITRHAESTHNLEERIASGPERGLKVSKLTTKGIEQAKKMGEELKKEGIDVIYCSPYARTKETAALISKIVGAKVIIDEHIGELNTGIFNGRLIKEHKAFFANPLEEFTKTPPGGENLTDAKRRMFAFLKDINNKHENQKILIVSHGDPLWVLAGAVKGLSNEEILKLSYPEIGEFQELSLSNWPYNNDSELDLHRPFIDEVFLKCPECGGKMRRVKEVADVWFDSGAMPFAQWHYPFQNKELVDKKLQFPADYITEAVDQTRGWFYTLLAVSVLLDADVPYHNVISLGHVLDKHGQKMSKSKGNTVDPMEMLRKYGADVLRWYFYTVNPPGEPKRFDENDLPKTFRRLFLIFYNSYVFFESYGENESNPNKLLDEWILSRLEETVGGTTAALDSYDINEGARIIEVFVDDLSRWYIRRSRKNVSGKVLKVVLEKLSRLIAPFIPFFAEALYQSLKNQNLRAYNEISVHLLDWPEANKKRINKDLLRDMDEIRRLASLALAEREKAGIKVRQPLAKLSVKNLKLQTLDKELWALLKDEINVKEIKFDNQIKNEIELDTNITPDLRKEGIIRELTRVIQGLRQSAGYQPQETVTVMLDLPKELLEIVEENLALLRQNVKAAEVLFKRQKFDAEINSKIESWEFWCGVRK